MADRISALEAEKSALISTNVPRDRSATASPNPANDAASAQTRFELAEALRSKGVIEKRLQSAEEELDTLRANNKKDARAIKHLTGQEMMLTRKLKDRDYELEQKKKLVSVS